MYSMTRRFLYFVIFTFLNIFPSINSSESQDADGLWIRIFPPSDQVLIICQGAERLGQPVMHIGNQMVGDAIVVSENKIEKELTYEEFRPNAFYACKFKNGEATFKYSDGPGLDELLEKYVGELSIRIDAKNRLTMVEFESNSHETQFQCLKNNVEMRLNYSDQITFHVTKGYMDYLQDDNYEYIYTCNVIDLKKFEFTIDFKESFPAIKDFRVDFFYNATRHMQMLSYCETFDIFEEESHRRKLELTSSNLPIYKSSTLKNVDDINAIGPQDITYKCYTDNDLGHVMAVFEFYNPHNWNLPVGDLLSVRTKLNEKTVDVMHYSKNGDYSQFTCIRNGQKLSSNLANKQIKSGDLWYENDISCSLAPGLDVKFSFVRQGMKPRITLFNLEYKANGIVEVKCGGSGRILLDILQVMYVEESGSGATQLSLPLEDSDQANEEYRKLPSSTPNVTYTYRSKSVEKPLGTFKCIVSTTTGSDEVEFTLRDDFGKNPVGTFKYEEAFPAIIEKPTISPDGPRVNIDSHDVCTPYNYLFKIDSKPIITSPRGSMLPCGKACYECYKKSTSIYSFKFRRDRIKKV